MTGDKKCFVNSKRGWEEENKEQRRDGIKEKHIGR